MQIDPPVLPPPEPPRPEPGLPVAAPLELVDAAAEYRLIPALRARAAMRDPTLVLAHAAVEHVKAARLTGAAAEAPTRFADAVADLAVTGRGSYDLFRAGLDPLRLLQLVGQRLDAQQLAPRPTQPEVDAAIDRTLDRAYAVAWALRGTVAQRAALRPGLGWVAVSAEDDMPHRPVNMAAPPFEQHEVVVRTPVSGGTLALATRFFVACADPPVTPPAPVPAAPVRRAPPDQVPVIPSDHHVLLFLHGHGSGAEEALEIIPALLAEGLARGRKYAVLSFDLPNNGYSETFDHSAVAPASATTFPFLPTDSTPLATPVLDFLEDFVVAFVDAVDDAAQRQGTPRITHRIAAVLGGSLGGNLGLRLGRRRPRPPWLRNVVAWSPASVWKAKVKHDPGREGTRVTRDNFTREPVDVPQSRVDYFYRVYDRRDGIIKPQPSYWYGKSFAQADAYITLSRWARREIYNQSYRLWHWRVACEQLIYSHVENVVYGDATTPVRYTLNTVRTLLASGEEDDAAFVGIYGATAELGEAMTGTPGRLLLVRETGHSIHAERPVFFAGQIASFLAEDPIPPPGRAAAAVAELLLDEPEPAFAAPRSSFAPVALLLLGGADQP